MIESRDTLPDAETLKIKIIEEFGARQKDVGNDSGAMFANVREKPYQNNRGGKNCGPSHNGASDKGQSKPKPTYKCKYCNRKGHKESECYSKKRDMSAKGQDAESANCAFFTGRAANADELWCIDSGCTAHLCKDTEAFSKFKKTHGDLKLADNSSTNVKDKGDIRIATVN